MCQRFVEEVEGKSNGAQFSLGNDVIIERESQAVWRFARGEEGRIVGIVVRKSERKLAAARDILVLVRLRDVRYMDLVKKCNGLTSAVVGGVGAPRIGGAVRDQWPDRGGLRQAWG